LNKGELLVSLDIGTSEIKVIIGEAVEDAVNIIGVGTAPSLGMKKGAVVDIDKTVSSIKKAVEQAEHMVDMHIENVLVSVNGQHIQLHPCHGVVAVQSEDREITNEDITRVIDGAQVMSIPPEREIIDVVPKQFIVDGQDEITDPRGMIGVRLEMEGTIITCSKTVLHNILKCVERAGLHISDICLQPLASGEIALSSDERNLGVALIDVGGGCTTVSIFENNNLTNTTVIPLGGYNITNDIAIGLRTTFDEAEQVKLNYGHAFYDFASPEERFEVNVIGSNQQESKDQLELSNIIEARLEEILLLAQKEIRRMGYNELRGGYVLTGGTMKMEGALELAQDIFYSNARIAIPDYIGVREPQYTVGVGTILFAEKNAKIQGKDLEPTYIQEQEVREPVQKPKKVRKKVKEQEVEDEEKESKISNFFKSFFE